MTENILETLKNCRYCGEIKPLNKFVKQKKGRDGYRWMCLQCSSAYKKAHYRPPSEEKKARDKASCIARAKEISARQKTYRLIHTEKIKAHCQDQKTKEKRNERLKKRYKANSKYRLRCVMTSAISMSLRGKKNGYHWEDLVSYTLEDLRKHLERRFISGMTWENHGIYWHIDHKIPISAFNFERPEDIDFKRCWSLKNLQPLESKENLIKGAKIDKPFQPALALG